MRTKSLKTDPRGLSVSLMLPVLGFMSKSASPAQHLPQGCSPGWHGLSGHTSGYLPTVKHPAPSLPHAGGRPACKHLQIPPPCPLNLQHLSSYSGCFGGQRPPSCSVPVQPPSTTCPGLSKNPRVETTNNSHA